MREAISLSLKQAKPVATLLSLKQAKPVATLLSLKQAKPVATLLSLKQAKPVATLLSLKQAKPVATLLCALLLVTGGCQPFGGPDVEPTPDDQGSQPLGAPDQDRVSTVDDLLMRGGAIAKEWQDEPVLTEVEVEVDPDGRWADARLVYAAPDADRILQLETSGSGFTQQRPSLETLQVQPVPAEALDEVPAFPDAAATPEQLATAQAAVECGVEGEASVLYASGAPFAWDGTAWTRTPAWQATVTTTGGRGARFDGVTAAGAACLDQ